MRKYLLSIALALFSLTVFAQSAGVAQSVPKDIFHAYLYNEEYKVYLDINLYAQDIVVPGQEIFGKTAGYFGAIRDSRKWLITSAKLHGKNRAEMEITNDYGSEDLSATLTYDTATGKYTLKQTGGSRLKIVVNRKWVKIPTELELTLHNRVADEW